MPPLSPLSKNCLALAVAQALSAGTAQAASIDVTSNLDDGSDCTLREAITTVNEGVDQTNGCAIDTTNDALGIDDTINFAPSLAGNTITLSGSELLITSDVSINPTGVNTTIDADQDSRVFNIDGSSTANLTVNLDQLTITGGNALDGGGILALSSSVNLSNSTLSGNSATRYGGGILAGSNSVVNLNNSTLSGNSATRSGGGIATFVSSVALNNSTLSGNAATGLTGYGGGIFNYNGSVALNNSTLSGNSATRYGGGMFISNGATRLYNSIIANSAGFNCIGGSSGTFASNTDSLSDDVTCFSATYVSNANLALDPNLADNGGPTQTHALLMGSPAINMATGAGATTSDQRGVAAVGIRDIGAFEKEEETNFFVIPLPDGKAVVVPL